MIFDHPGLAFGAFLGLLPPLLHLLDRRKARSLPFAAIDFLLRAQRGGARRFRLRRLLLMLARMAILTALPLALARPHRALAAAAKIAEGPRATALILDGSGSMRYRRGGKTLFARAQQEARRRLFELNPDEPATVLLCAPRAAAPLPPSDERASLVTRLEGFVPTQEASDLAGCIQQAAQALAQSELPGKRITVFTDLQQTGWDLGAPPPVIPSSKGEVRPELEVVDVAEGDLPNLALSDLQIAAAPAVGPHGYQFTFTVHNSGSQPQRNVPVNLQLGDQILARGFCDLEPWGTQRKTLAATFTPGTVAEGRVALPPDALTTDDALPFVLPVARQARVLLIDGAPSTLRYLDEAFFVQTALEGAGGAVAVQTVDSESLTPQLIESSGLDVIALLNVHSVPKDTAAALRRFVERGGGLWIALGDRIDPEALNDSLGSLLPAQLRLVKTAALPAPAEGASAGAATLLTQAPARFTHVDLQSPIFAGFGAGSTDGLLDTRIFRYVLVEPPPKDVSVLASYDDGAPALLLAQRKAGKVLLVTTSLAREWTDWPIRASFVPVMQQTIRVLAHLEEEALPPALIVGGRKVFPAAELVPVGLRSPSGHEWPLETLSSGARSFQPLAEVGLWQVHLADAAGHRSESRRADVPVVFDPRESDTRRIDPREITARYGAVVRAEEISSQGAAPGRLGLWTELLVLAALFFVAEALLG